MAKITMHRLATGKVAAEDLASVIAKLSALGFDVSTRAKFVNVSHFLVDQAPFDAAMSMDDAAYQEIQGAAVGGKLVDDVNNSKYDPSEWSEAEKPHTVDLSGVPQETLNEYVKPSSKKISMVGLIQKAAQVDKLLGLIKDLGAAGFRTDNRETMYQILAILTSSTAGVKRAGTAATMVANLTDEQYAKVLAGEGEALMGPPGSSAAPLHIPSAPVQMEKTGPNWSKGMFGKQPEAPQAQPPAATPAQLPVSQPSTRGTPGVLPAGPQVQLSTTKFVDTQKANVKGEMTSHFDDLVAKAKQVVPGFKTGLLGDDLDVRVRNKSEPPAIKKNPSLIKQEPVATPVKVGGWVANYDRTDMTSLSGQGGDGVMYEAMAIGTAPNDGLVVVTFPDGSGNDRSGEFAVWYPKKDNIRLSSHQSVKMPKVSIKMTNVVAQMAQGQAQDQNGQPIVPGSMIQDPNGMNNQNGGQVVDVKQDGSVIYQNDQGEKVMKSPGAPVEVIKQEDQSGQVQELPDQPQQSGGVGGPNMVK
jgi:hypothetical protein